MEKYSRNLDTISNKKLPTASIFCKETKPPVDENKSLVEETAQEKCTKLLESMFSPSKIVAKKFVEPNSGAAVMEVPGMYFQYKWGSSLPPKKVKFFIYGAILLNFET